MKGARASATGLKIALSGGWGQTGHGAAGDVHQMDNCLESTGGDILEMSCTGIISIAYPLC